MSAGPIIQFWIRERPSILKFLKTPPSSSYLTFASGGYIISIKPMAIGILVVLSGEDFKESQNVAIDGKKYPEKTPINIARKIHKVK
jgi:type IV secretory pathway protease TraF